MQLARFLNSVFKKDGFILENADSQNYIIGTPKYSKLKDISCPYAVEWVDKGGILQMRCKENLNIKDLLN